MSDRPECNRNMMTCPVEAWADAEIERLRALLREVSAAWNADTAIANGMKEWGDLLRRIKAEG